MKPHWKTNLPGYHYDHSKRMWWRHRSTCHQAPLRQKMMYLGKVVTDPNFQIVTTGTNKVKRKWWQLWKPKFKTTTSRKVKDVRFRYSCDDCDKQNNGEWDFIHEDNSPKLNPNSQERSTQWVVIGV